MKELRYYVPEMIAFAVAAMVTALSIYYNYNKFVNLENENILANWNYISMSVTITIITFLVAWVYKLMKKIALAENAPIRLNEISEMLVSYWFLLIVLIMLLYPDLEVLKISNDPAMFSTIISINTIQTSALYYFYSDDRSQRTSYWIYLFIANVIVVLSSPFIVNLVS